MVWLLWGTAWPRRGGSRVRKMLTLSVWEVYLSTQLLPQQGLGQLHAVQQVL